MHPLESSRCIELAFFFYMHGSSKVTVLKTGTFVLPHRAVCWASAGKSSIYVVSPAGTMLLFLFFFFFFCSDNTKQMILACCQTRGPSDHMMDSGWDRGFSFFSCFNLSLLVPLKIFTYYHAPLTIVLLFFFVFQCTASLKRVKTIVTKE